MTEEDCSHLLKKVAPCNLPYEVASRDINQQVPAVTCGRIRSMSDSGSQDDTRLATVTFWISAATIEAERRSAVPRARAKYPMN